MVHWVKENKEGFSLVELMIIIGIVAILTGGAALGFGLLHSADVKGASERINSSLNELKSQNMAGGSTYYLNIYLHDGNYYTKISKGSPLQDSEITGSGKKIGTNTIKISFNGTELQNDKIYSFSIKKSDGSFGIRKSDNTFVSRYYVRQKGDSNPVITPDESTSAPSLIKITVEGNNGGTVHTVNMVWSTGRHYTD